MAHPLNRGCRIRKAGFRKVQKPPGYLSVTTTTGTKCLRLGSCWHWGRCEGALCRRKRKNSGKCCCVRFQTPLKATICLCATFHPVGLRAERRRSACSHVTTISPRQRFVSRTCGGPSRETIHVFLEWRCWTGVADFAGVGRRANVPSQSIPSRRRYLQIFVLSPLTVFPGSAVDFPTL